MGGYLHYFDLSKVAFFIIFVLGLIETWKSLFEVVSTKDKLVALTFPAAGYKGYGLAMMVEVMCGMLGGGPFAHHIRKWTGDQRVANLVRQSDSISLCLFIMSHLRA